MRFNRNYERSFNRVDKGDLALGVGNNVLFRRRMTSFEGGFIVRYCTYDLLRNNMETGEIKVTASDMVPSGVAPMSISINQRVGLNTNVTFNAAMGGDTLYIQANALATGWYITYEVIEGAMPHWPMIQMTVSGLGGGQTWKGMGNGTHFLRPDGYSIFTRNAYPGTIARNNETWTHSPLNAGPIPANSFDGIFKIRCNQVLNTGYSMTYGSFFVYSSGGFVGAVNNWYGSPIYFGGTGLGLLSSQYGHIKDRALNNSGTVGGITFTWQRVNGQPVGVWGNY